MAPVIEGSAAFVTRVFWCAGAVPCFHTSYVKARHPVPRYQRWRERLARIKTDGLGLLWPSHKRRRILLAQAMFIAVAAASFCGYSDIRDCTQVKLSTILLTAGLDILKSKPLQASAVVHVIIVSLCT